MSEIELAPKAHAKFSASSAARWLACPGSITLIEKAPPQIESKYAKEGTDAHTCVERLLKAHGGKFATEKHKLLKEYPGEMVEHAWQTYQLISDLVKEGDELLCETKVDLSFVAPDTFGTVDAAVLDYFNSRLTVIDFKYGAGVAVEAEGNAQLIFYALGLSAKHDHMFEEVELVIMQPRAYHQKGPLRSHKMTREELLGWENKFKLGVLEATTFKESYTAGDHCKFCPAKVICPALSKQAFKQAQIDFAPEIEVIRAPAPTGLEGEVLGKTIRAIEQLEKWIEAVKEHAFSVLQNGHTVPGYKLVEKHGTRKWLDSEKEIVEDAEIILGTDPADCFETPKLLSPAQFEKKFSKVKGIEEFLSVSTSSVSSGLTMVPDSDKRLPTSSAQIDFSKDGLKTLKKIHSTPNIAEVIRAPYKPKKKQQPKKLIKKQIKRKKKK